jgi:hypothetical protein
MRYTQAYGVCKVKILPKGAIIKNKLIASYNIFSKRLGEESNLTTTIRNIAALPLSSNPKF